MVNRRSALLDGTVLFCFAFLLALPQTEAQTALNVEDPYHEAFRPQLHFSPREKWMNDPNGMVWFHGVYHLFFQFYPYGTVWGPMHWGHATSHDLVHWRQQPIALYPDSLGYIFSGSAVVDSNNTSGFGRNGKIPLVAIFTHHDPEGEKRGLDNFQNESIAYSLDEGRTWTKYPGNPVLHNPGIKDFRDPKVMWYAPRKRWIMTLATRDRISFFSSPDLKDWTKESEFGSDRGAHGGVWECPDLFPLELEGKTWWVLFVSINPGGPNGGSATQYFIGQFDGSVFTSADGLPASADRDPAPPSATASTTKWVDYGPDDYAGVTWSNTGKRRIFLGWMSNWNYANQVPTRSWRNAMTVPRELSLRCSGGQIYLCSRPVKELDALKMSADPHASSSTSAHSSSSAHFIADNGNQYIAHIEADPSKDFTVDLLATDGAHLTIGFDHDNNRYYIDRSHAGSSDFHPGFEAKAFAPRLTNDKTARLMVVVDVSSVELFADGGLTVMTAIFFPAKPLNWIAMQADDMHSIRIISRTPLKSIW